MFEELIEGKGLAAGAESVDGGGDIWRERTGVAGFEGGEEGVDFGVGWFGDAEGVERCGCIVGLTGEVVARVWRQDI